MSPDNNLSDVSAEEEILARYEAELKTLEARVSKLKRMIVVLKSWDLKWRTEIRRCLQDQPDTLLTSGEMAGIIAGYNNLPDKDRNTRVKIS